MIPTLFTRYYEPFVGGGAIFFKLSHLKKVSYLVDTNHELITAYRVIQSNPHQLIGALKVHNAHHDKNYFAMMKKLTCSDPIEVAARFIYLNATCFNGIYRVNRKGEFNVSLGVKANFNIVKADVILACHEALKNVHIIDGDYKCIDPREGDFVYLDPPYHKADRGQFVSYTSNVFTNENHRELAEFCKELDGKGVRFMVTNSGTDYIKELYKDFNITEVGKIPYLSNMAKDVKHRESEIIITNYI
jgi:DNA adenine methylase